MRISNLAKQKSAITKISLLIIMFLLALIVSGCNLFNTVNTPSSKPQIATTDQYKDFLTPEYYLAKKGNVFIDEVNNFLYHAKKEPFHNPFKNESGQIQNHILSPWRQFGSEIGPRGGAKFMYHPADDVYAGEGMRDKKSNINLYAVYDGYISTYRDAPKYRQYLSITKEVKDDNGKLLGKIVTLYAHIDLDLDETSGLKIHGKRVKKGALVSKHLWTGTKGGPHIHFEIRFYRPEDNGTEEFYGSMYGPRGNKNLSKSSAGDWSLGHWDPETGYGFGNPGNFHLKF